MERKGAFQAARRCILSPVYHLAAPALSPMFKLTRKALHSFVRAPVLAVFAESASHWGTDRVFWVFSAIDTKGALQARWVNLPSEVEGLSAEGRVRAHMKVLCFPEDAEHHIAVSKKREAAVADAIEYLRKLFTSCLLLRAPVRTSAQSDPRAVGVARSARYTLERTRFLFSRPRRKTIKRIGILPSSTQEGLPFFGHGYFPCCHRTAAKFWVVPPYPSFPGCFFGHLYRTFAC